MNFKNILKSFYTKGNQFCYIRLLLTGGLIGILSVYIYPYILKWYTGASAISEMGQYGDVYGGLNTLFTGLAFVGLIITIIQQRQEMQETRDEFKEQTKQFEIQSNIMSKQVLDSSMFEYLQYMRDIKENVKSPTFEHITYFLSSIMENIDTISCNLDNEIDVSDKNFEYLHDNINQIRERLRKLAPWRRVYTAWNKRVDQGILMSSNSENNSLSKQNYIQYKKNFWHLLSLEDRFLVFLQTAFLAEIHLSDWEEEKKEYFESSAIQTAFRSLNCETKRQQLILALLYPCGEDSADSVHLSVEQTKSICEQYFNNVIVKDNS